MKMREIKFRGWNKQDKHMLEIFDNTNGIHWYLPNWKEKWEVMQYTGLKDKNDVEIYEGDIVIYLQRNMNAAFGFEKGKDYTEEKRVIRFHNQSFNVPQGFIKELEVIGNIYEHPHLLEVD